MGWKFINESSGRFIEDFPEEGVVVLASDGKTVFPAWHLKSGIYIRGRCHSTDMWMPVDEDGTIPEVIKWKYFTGGRTDGR